VCVAGVDVPSVRWVSPDTRKACYELRMPDKHRRAHEVPEPAHTLSAGVPPADPAVHASARTAVAGQTFSVPSPTWCPPGRGRLPLPKWCLKAELEHQACQGNTSPPLTHTNSPQYTDHTHHRHISTHTHTTPTTQTTITADTSPSQDAYGQHILQLMNKPRKK